MIGTYEQCQWQLFWLQYIGGITGGKADEPRMELSSAAATVDVNEHYIVEV